LRYWCVITRECCCARGGAWLRTSSRRRSADGRVPRRLRRFLGRQRGQQRVRVCVAEQQLANVLPKLHAPLKALEVLSVDHLPFLRDRLGQLFGNLRKSSPTHGPPSTCSPVSRELHGGGGRVLVLSENSIKRNRRDLSGLRDGRPDDWSRNGT